MLSCFCAMQDQQTKKKADLKVVLLGESSVGKTCLVSRYLNGTFEDTAATIGASFFLRPWGSSNAAIWDTAGEERFHGLSGFYCRCAGAAILAFDPQRRETFESLRERYIPLLDAAEPGCLAVVVATKHDLLTDSNSRVSSQEAVDLALSVNSHNSAIRSGVPYYETSSLSGHNVDQMFEYIFTHCLGSPNATQQRRSQLGKRHDVVMIHDGTEQNSPENSKCC